MNHKKFIKKYFKWENVRFLYYSIIFNFKVLPFKQARHLPFFLMVKPVIISNAGKIIIDSPIEKGMIRIGRQRTPIRMPQPLIWRNMGIIVFKGKCKMGHSMMIQTGEDGYLEFGDQVAFNCGCKVVSMKSIIFKYKSKVSWDCQIFDTDFHPIMDIIRNKPLKTERPIVIGKEVWLGHNVIVSKGVKLADGIIVSSGSNVKNSCSTPNCVLAGNPAYIIDEGYKAMFNDVFDKL